MRWPTLVFFLCFIGLASAYANVTFCVCSELANAPLNYTITLSNATNSVSANGGSGGISVPYPSAASSCSGACSSWNAATTPQGEVTVKIEHYSGGDNFVTRYLGYTWDNNTYLNTTAYVLLTTDPNNAWSYFTVLSSTQTSLPNAYVWVNKSIGGTSKTMSSGWSDSAGRFNVVLDDLSTYYVGATYGSASSGSNTVNNPSGSYYIVISPNPLNVSWENVLTHLTGFLTPYYIGLNDSDALIKFNLTSTDSNLSVFGLNITVNGTLVASNYSNTAAGAEVSTYLTFNSTNNSETIYATYYWVKLDGSTFNNTIVYLKYSGATEYSLVSFLSHMKSAGVPEFGLALFALFSIIFVSVFVSKFNGTAGVVSALLLMALFVVYGFFDLPGLAGSGVWLGFMLAVVGVGIIILGLRS